MPCPPSWRSQCQKFKIACRNYVTNKDIAEEKQTMKVMTALKDPCCEDWVKVHYNELKVLPLKTFLAKFKDNFMPVNWEMDVCIELNSMSQGDHQSFCDLAVTVPKKNGLLKNTELLLNTICLYTHIKVGMDPTLNNVLANWTRNSISSRTFSLELRL